MVPIIDFCVCAIGLVLLGLQLTMAALILLAKILVLSGLLNPEGKKRGLSGFLLNFS
jgi:hypothetical protein